MLFFAAAGEHALLYSNHTRDRETAPITIAKGKTLYYRIPADNVPMLYFVLCPCFGAVEYDVFVNKEVGGNFLLRTFVAIFGL